VTARFLYLDNGGWPTNWDATRYFAYLRKVRSKLPMDLQSLTDKQRYALPSDSDLSLWRSTLNYIHVNGATIVIGGVNETESRRFELIYSGVCKVQTTSSRFYFMPALVIQELVQLRNGLLRHTLSDMGGDLTTIHASSIAFQESIIQ
jgi:hypothetical protein